MSDTRIPMPILSAMHPGNPHGLRFVEGDGGESGAGQQASDGDDQGQQEQAQTFTQADVDRIVSERLQRERAKFADYDDLKAKAGRVDELEQKVPGLEHEVLRRRVQATHGISNEDTDLFLTGTDEETLTNQASRLKSHASAQQNNGNHSPGEGNTPQSTVSSERQAARQLFGRD